MGLKFCFMIINMCAARMKYRCFGERDSTAEMDGTNSSLIFMKTCKSFNDGVHVITKFPSDENLVEHVILLVVGKMMFLSSVFLNGVVITAILLCSQLRAKVSCFTILARSLMDLAFGLVMTPLFIIFLSHEIKGNVNCDLIFIAEKLGPLLIGYSLTIMSMMNVERYMGILHPLTHRVKVTKTRLLKYTILALAIQTILFAPSVIDNQITPFVVAATTFLLIATTVFVYTRIWLSQLHTRNAQSRRHAFVQSQSPAVNGRGKLMKEIKLARTSFTIVVCFVVCFLPITISNIEREESSTQPSFTTVVRRRWYFLLAISSTIMNPIIFFWTNKALRTSGVKSITRSVFFWHVR